MVNCRHLVLKLLDCSVRGRIEIFNFVTFLFLFLCHDFPTLLQISCLFKHVGDPRKLVHKVLLTLSRTFHLPLQDLDLLIVVLEQLIYRHGLRATVLDQLLKLILQKSLDSLI